MKRVFLIAVCISLGGCAHEQLTRSGDHIITHDEVVSASDHARKICQHDDASLDCQSAISQADAIAAARKIQQQAIEQEAFDRMAADLQPVNNPHRKDEVKAMDGYLKSHSE